MHVPVTFLTSIGASALSFLKGGGESRDSGRSVKWLDGLRGIASILVILTHLTRAWDYDLFFPLPPPREPEMPLPDYPRLLQLPFLRIPWQGRLGVTIFGFLTGYVCALKPLKLSRSGDHDAAFSAIAKSAFRRPPRLILPAAIAMVIAWVFAQLGGFTVGNRADAEWIRYASPEIQDSLFKEIKRLFSAFLSTWTNGYMDYDDHQWALLPLLKGSMMVYVTLVATMYVQYRYRMLIYTGMYLYFHQNPAPDTETFGQQLYYGMFLCDLAGHESTQAFISSLHWSRRIFCITITLIGLYIASFPGEAPEWCAWSKQLLDLAHYIFPRDVNIGKRYSALGVDLVILATYLSPSSKTILSKPFFQFLGRNSFAVYLTHGTLLRVVLTWMLYGISGQPWEERRNEEGEVIPPEWLPRGGPVRFTIAIPIWIGLVYLVAHLWTTYVDSFCARLTQRLENHLFGQDEKSSSQQLPQ